MLYVLLGIVSLACSIAWMLFVINTFLAIRQIPKEIHELTNVFRKSKTPVDKIDSKDQQVVPSSSEIIEEKVELSEPPTVSKTPIPTITTEEYKQNMRFAIVGISISVGILVVLIIVFSIFHA